MTAPQGSSDLLSPKPIQFHPLARLDGFGRNKLGDNLYRVVFAPSRMKMLGGRWPNGAAEYRFVPLYRSKGWILERWMSPLEFAGMGPERWEIEYRDPSTGLFVQGPYPHRGEYEMCFDFMDTDPTRDYACRVVAMIQAGRLRPFGEHLRANRDHAAAEEKARDARNLDQIRNVMPTFHGQILSAPGGSKRSFKSGNNRIAAEHLTINGKKAPIGKNKFIAA